MGQRGTLPVRSRHPFFARRPATNRLTPGSSGRSIWSFSAHCKAFAGWLAKVTLHQAYGFLRVRNRLVATEDLPSRDVLPDTLGEDLELDVVRRAIRAGLAMLAPEQQRFLQLLFSDPPLDYQTVAEILDKSTGYIGPTRRRTLEALARTKPVARLIEDERPSAEGDGHA